MDRLLLLSDAEIRAASVSLAAFLTDYEAHLGVAPVLPDLDHAALERILDEPLPAEGRNVEDLFDELRGVVMPNSTAIASGRFLAYVLATPTNLAPFAEAVSAALNQNCNLWTLSPAANAIEQRVVSWFLEWFGMQGGGILTGGGSLANLAALTVARDRRNPAVRRDGLAAGARQTMYTSTEAHSSIDKALSIIGMGSDSLRRLPVDASLGLDVDALEGAIALDRSHGFDPSCVIATAGTVTTGAFDALAEVAAVCEREGLWLHVDGAYGALAILTERGSALLRGIDRADSVTLDPHKLLFMPLEAGCVLFRDPDTWRSSFTVDSPYLGTPSQDRLVHYADYSPQLSRSFRALKIWWALRAFGVNAFREAIERQLWLARYMGERVTEHSRFELATAVTFTAVCFRPTGVEDAEMPALLARLLASGDAFLGPATVAGRSWLRACFVNLRTTEADIDAIIDTIDTLASDLRP